MANRVKLGNLEIDAFKVGDSDCKVYLGDILLYPNVETRVVAKFNVTDTSNPTPISYKAQYQDYTSGFSAIEIDGVTLPSVVSAYTFSTTGEHTVKYTLTDPTTIIDGAFYRCSDLTSVTIPDTVTSIGGSAFYYCRNLTSVNIPSGVATINGHTFYVCDSLISIDIPNSVTSIGNNAFQYCSGLTNVTIGNGVTSIGNNAFRNCSGMTTCTMGSGVTSIGTYAFESCTALTSIDIPDSVTSIGNNVFNNCSGLASVTIGSGVTSIGGSAFLGCHSLTSITVEATTPPTLGNNAFDDTNHCQIYVPTCSLVNTYNTANGWSNYSDRIGALDCPPTVIAKLNVTDTSSPTRILGSNMTGFAKVEIDGVEQQNVTSGYTFNTTGEHTVRYTFKGQNSISVNAFSGCTRITSIDISSNITSIGQSAFTYCTSVSSITINATIPPTLGTNAFGYTTCSIYVPCESVDTYKAASGWSTYASRIKGFGCSITNATVTCDSATYNGSNQIAQNIVVTYDGATLISGVDYTVAQNIGGTNAGSYPIVINGMGNYTGTTNGTFTINKVTPTVVAPTPKVLTYNGSAQELVNAGSTNFGTLKYKVGSDSWSTSVPTRTRSGSYELYYKVDGDSNVYDVPSASTTCSINEKQVTATVTLSQTTYTYNGSACQPTPTVKDGTTVIDPSEYTVTYSNNVNAGTATVTISDNVGGDYEVIGSATFTINKADQSAPGATGATTTYPATATATASGGGGQGSIEWESTQSQSSVGSHTTRARWSGNSNYNASPWSSSVTVQMNKAAGSVTTAPVNNNYTYNGTARAVASAGSGTGTMYYRLGASGSFSTTMPTMTDVGSNTLYYYAAESTNYTQSTTGSITVSVQKADQAAPGVTGSTTTYPTTASATASGGGGIGSIEWESAQSQTSVGSHTTRARWSGNSNYNASPWSSSVTVQMNKAAGSVTTAPVNNNYTYNGTARAVASAGSGTGTMYYRLGTSGSFSTTMPTMTDAGSNTLYYYAAASTNYEQSSTGSITVSVQKANISPTVSISTWTYGGTPSNPYVAGNSGSGTVTYYYKLSTASSWSTTKPSDAGSYNIRADIAATSNYNSGSCTNNFTIAKAASSLSFNVSRLSVGVGEIKTNVVTVNAGDGTVTYNSSNTTAVTVNNSGVVTGVNYGEATITATISSTNNYNSASTSYTVACAAFFTTTYDIIDTTNPTRIGSAMTNLVEVEFDDGISYTKYALRTGHTFSTTGEHTVKYYLANPALIGTSALTKCDRLTSVNIPDNITTISGYAFQGCSSLTSVVIPDSVTKIADYSVFDYCTSLTSVTIGSGITSIGTWAFSYCRSLTSITINATSPPTLGSDVFRNTNNCPIYVPTCSLVSTYKGRSGWSDYSSRICALDCYYITTKFNVTTTSSPTIIANATTSFNLIEIDGTPMCVMSAYTFSTTGEHTIKYYLSETSIGYNAFQGCSSLTSVTIPEDVTSIGFQAFCNCSGLTSCTIGSGVTSIEDRAFYRCSGLTSIDIPNSVTSIGASAFTSCSGLTSCTIGSGVTSINQQTFYNCNSLTSIDIPNSVTSIGNSAFTYCSGLTSIDIPNSVTSIGGSAFRDCSGLTSCTIGNGVTSIGDMSFQNCTSLTSITSNRTTAPTITNYTFRNVKTNGTLTVPQGSTGYDIWMGTGNYYLGLYNWTKVEQ